jgi:hypothetical protein
MNNGTTIRMRKGRFAAAEQELGGTALLLRLDFLFILVPLRAMNG